MGRVFKPRRKKSDGQIWTSPKWYVEYREAGGVQKRIPASTSKTEAIGLLRELEGRERRRTLGLESIPKKCPSLSLDGLIQAYLQDAEFRLRRSTFESYKDSLYMLLLGINRRGEQVGTRHSLEDITISWANTYQRTALEDSAPSTINRKLRAVTQMLNWAVRTELLKTSPLQHLQRLQQSPQRELRALTRREVQALMSASTKETRGLWSLFLDTGMRKAEVSSLSWKEVDLDRQVITIEASKSKNKKPRIIPMTKRVLQVLQARRRRAKKAQEELVFPRVEGHSNFYEGCLIVFKRCCAWAGIKGVTIHSLRRSFAVRMLELGASPGVVQRLLGHSTANLTLEVYAKVNTVDLRGALGLLST